MKRAFGLDIPTSLGEWCVPQRLALIVYDMQAGIVPQIDGSAAIVAGCERVVAAARAGGFRIFYTRHIYLPNRIAGVGQLRRAMVWQKQDDPEQTKPWFGYGSPAWQIVPQLTPRNDEAVIDKITMSAFEGTYLDIALRDAGLQAFLIMGIALEVGIEPTVRHGLDLNYVPVMVPELCGSKTTEAHERSLTTLRETGEVYFESEATMIELLRGSSTR